MQLPKINHAKWRMKFTKDLLKKEYLPIKLLFFIIFGANMALIPFLTLQARSLGITEEEVGIIYSFIPIASLIAPALSGMLADRIGNFKILLSFLTALTGVSGILFMFVPPGRIAHKMPEALPLELTYSSTHGNSLHVVKPYECVNANKQGQMAIDVLQCSVKCLNSTDFEDEISANISQNNLFCNKSSGFIKSRKQDYWSEKEDYSENNNKNSTEVVYSNSSYGFNPEAFNQSINVHFFYNEEVGFIQHNSGQQFCPQSQEGQQLPENCFTVCHATVERAQMCQNKVTVEEINPSVTFYSHLAIRLFKEFSLVTSMPLLEGAAVAILKEHDGDFGFQRLYCNIGMMVMTPISGTLIDYFSLRNGMEDFRPAMYMYCGLKLLAAFIILFLKLDFKKPSSKVISDFSSLMLNAEILFFLLATFLAGTCYGYIETFLFWLLEDLGADKQFMGLTLTVGSVFGIPVLMISTFIMKKIGHVNTIILGFIFYIVRLLGYTMISNPWWAMPFEALECFTVSLMVVAFVSYSTVLATPATMVTLQGMYGGLYNGVGRGAGSLIGGFLIENLGIFHAFRVIAAISGASGLSYWAIHFLLFRKKKQESLNDAENQNIAMENRVKETELATNDRQARNDKITADQNYSQENKNTELKDINISGIENKGFDDD